MAETIFVKISTRQKLLFQGEVRALTSFNQRGVFDILPQHANFITMIKKQIIVYIRDGEKKEFPIDSGILEVSENKVGIYIGIGSPAAA